MNLNATLVVQFVVFFILAGFTMKFVWPPLMKALDERAKKIADGLAAAEKGKLELADANKRVENELASSRAANQLRVAEAEKQAALVIEDAKKQNSRCSVPVMSCATRLQRWQLPVPSRSSSVKSTPGCMPICCRNSKRNFKRAEEQRWLRFPQSHVPTQKRHFVSPRRGTLMPGRICSGTWRPLPPIPKCSL